MRHSQLYYITDRHGFFGSDFQKRSRLLGKISEAAQAGIDYIQLREKDLSPRELEALAREAVARVREVGSQSRLLINSRVDIALAVGADGVHLRSDDISPREVRAVASLVGIEKFLIGVSCHSVDAVRKAEADGADFAVFAPVFEKKDTPRVAPAGLDKFREACKRNLPVFALGGINLANSQSCLDAGATGIAAIRLFQENKVREILQRLRSK